MGTGCKQPQPGSIRLEELPSVTLSVGTIPFSLSALLLTEAWLTPGQCCWVGEVLSEANRCGLPPQGSG